MGVQNLFFQKLLMRVSVEEGLKDRERNLLIKIREKHSWKLVLNTIIFKNEVSIFVSR